MKKTKKLKASNSKTPKITLYLYTKYSSSNWGSGGFSYNKCTVGYLAPNDDFMMSILESQLDWNDFTNGDSEEYEARDSDGGFTKLELEKKIDFYSEEDLDKVPELSGEFI
jgi:hypothetical protein